MKSSKLTQLSHPIEVSGDGLFVDGIYEHIHFRYSKPGSDSLVVPRHYYGMEEFESMFGYLWFKAILI